VIRDLLVAWLMRRGDRVGIIGANGAGKTTSAARCILGEREADAAAGCGAAAGWRWPTSTSSAAQLDPEAQLGGRGRARVRSIVEVGGGRAST
jgi:ABC-type glutathione transport system ATPase component